MNNRFKFRVWDYNYKRFCPINVDCYTIKYQGDCWLISASKLYDETCFPYARLDSDRFKMIEFTGLKDKNGNEIFEGDIVKYKLWRIGMDDKRQAKLYSSVVVFKDGEFFPRPQKNINDEYDSCSWETFDFEVIGNIFEI